MYDLKENRYTPANDWCPKPEYWHSPDSEATEMEVSEFLGALVRIIQPEYVVETGTYHGHTALVMGAALYENGHGRLDTIENNGLAYSIADERLSEFPEYPVRLHFQNTMEFIPEQEINFLFLDSWQEGRVEEFNRFRDMGLIRSGMFFAVHDTAPHHQVRKTIAAFNAPFGMLDFHTPRGLIVGQVL